MKKVLIIIFVILFPPFLYIFQPWVFLPHERIEIILPFRPSADYNVRIIPMGEMIEHNRENGNPNGHPGIDFGFMGVTEIISSSDGVILEFGKSEYGSYDVVVQSGNYKIAYKELNSLDKKIKFLARVKKGDLIGYTGRSKVTGEKPKPGDPSGQVHWEFLSSSLFIDRLCPLEYFDSESERRINDIWGAMDEEDVFKKEYKDICNGVYKDKVF